LWVVPGFSLPSLYVRYSADGDRPSLCGHREAFAICLEEVGMEDRAFVVFITTPSEEEGLRIARTLVEERLAACVNIIPRVTSVYRWEGAVQEDRESFLVVKTSQESFKALSRRVKEMHSYQVPEIIALPIECGQDDYIRWLFESVG